MYVLAVVKVIVTNKLQPVADVTAVEEPVVVVAGVNVIKVVHQAAVVVVMDAQVDVKDVLAAVIPLALEDVKVVVKGVHHVQELVIPLALEDAKAPVITLVQAVVKDAHHVLVHVRALVLALVQVPVLVLAKALVLGAQIVQVLVMDAQGVQIHVQEIV